MRTLAASSGAVRQACEGVQASELRSHEDYVLHLIRTAAYREAIRFATGNVVLDVGCGDGYGTRILGEVCKSVTGVDVSPSAIEAARTSNSGSNIEYRLIHDGLPFPDAAFDFVVSAQVIDHIEDPIPYLTEIRRVLVPGGIALLTTPNAAIRLDRGMKPWTQCHVREFNASEFEKLLLQAFSNVRISGLFASPDVYEVEFERVQRRLERERQRLALEASPAWKIKRALWMAITAVLPKRLCHALRNAFGPKAPPGNGFASEPELEFALRRFIARFSIEDVFYRNERLDRALDLMAVCRP
jgi:SAM-dependent methyltransferase